MTTTALINSHKKHRIKDIYVYTIRKIRLIQLICETLFKQNCLTANAPRIKKLNTSSFKFMKKTVTVTV